MKLASSPSTPEQRPQQRQAQARPATADAADEFLQQSAPGLLASRAVWGGALLSVAAWTLIAYLMTGLFTA